MVHGHHPHPYEVIDEVNLDECEEVTGENTDDMVETNKDNPEETEATATSAMPVDDDSNQEVVIKCETRKVEKLIYAASSFSEG